MESTPTQMIQERSDNTADRFLQVALIFTIFIHGVAMISMALILLPGMPGGGATDDIERIRYIAEHPWLWRLGWLPWQITALSDLLLGMALLRVRWIHLAPAVITMLITIAAVFPDQLGQVLWITEGIDLAAYAVRTGEYARYLSYESWIFAMTAVWGATFYTLGALGWTWCFATAGIWNRALTWISIPLWSIFAYVSLGPLLPESLRPSANIVSAGNALGFLLLMAWLLIVLELVLRRSRPTAAHGRYAPWRHPSRGIGGRLLNGIANSYALRAIFEFLPPLSLASDITDVIYINYLVEAERLEHLVPRELELQRLGEGGRYALFTFLTYKHGGFGPRLAGGLRRFAPSPVQSNWRIHVSDPQTGKEGIYFVTNAVSNMAISLGARMLSEGMPMHVLRHGEVQREPDGEIYLRLDPGNGSAPDVEARLRPTEHRLLEHPWSDCFASYHDFLAYCVPQDRAFSSQPWHNRVTRQEIELGIPLDTCEPLAGEVRSHAAEIIVGDATPLCFRVPGVSFRFDREEYDRRTSAAALPGEG